MAKRPRSFSSCNPAQCYEIVADSLCLYGTGLVLLVMVLLLAGVFACGSEPGGGVACVKVDGDGVRYNLC